jgi:hypothetical protein
MALEIARRARFKLFGTQNYTVARSSENWHNKSMKGGNGFGSQRDTQVHEEQMDLREAAL